MTGRDVFLCFVEYVLVVILLTLIAGRRDAFDEDGSTASVIALWPIAVWFAIGILPIVGLVALARWSNRERDVS